MGNVVNRLSNLILLVLIAGSYWLWATGLNNPYTVFVYENSAYICLFTAIFLLTLRFKQLTKVDISIILVAIGSLIIFFITTDSPDLTVPLLIPTIFLLLICFKKTRFDSIDYLLLLGISIASLIAILFRMCLRVSAGKPFWINTNTLGTAILFSAITIIILLKSFKIGVLKHLLIVLVYAVSLIAIWRLTSETAFILLIFFGVLDNFFPKKIIQSSKMNIMSFIFPLLFISIPLLTYFVAQSDVINIFSGREEIWFNFFQDWLSSPKKMLVGSEPFYTVLSGKTLGAHNSFVFVLSAYGLLGYLLLFGFIGGFIATFWKPKAFHSKRDISFLIGFLCVCIHSTMEQTLTSFFWLPIAYLFLGLTTSDQQPKEKQTRSAANT